MRRVGETLEASNSDAMATKNTTKNTASNSVAADEELHQPKRVVMKPEELEKTAERLYGHSVKKIQEQKKKFDADVEYQFTHNHKTKATSAEPSDAEKAALERLYSQPIERKKRNIEAAEKKQASLVPPSKKVGPEEVDQITDRLFAQAMKRKEQNLATSTKKLYGDDKGEKKLDKEQLGKRVQSLFNEAVDKKKTAMEKLTEQYQWKIDKKTISKEDAKAMADRLSAKQ
jgi:hypothetical protein